MLAARTRDANFLREGGVWLGRSVLCLSVRLSSFEPLFSRENSGFPSQMQLRFRHWRPLVVSFTPTEAGIRSSAPNRSIGFSVTRFAHEPAAERCFQEKGTLLPV